MRKIRQGETLTVGPEDVRFACPFCDREVVTVSSVFGVMHAEPPCEKFVALEVTDYLHAVNVAFGNYH